jgi:general stress protein 26
MDVKDFSELAAEFEARTRRIVWCTVATVADTGAPWTRILHPIWDGPTGWIATTRQSLKSRHVRHAPRISLTYWDARHDIVTVHGRASWADDLADKERIWAMYQSAPPPLGYDPGLFWRGGPADPAFGVLRIDPTRIELTSMAGLGKPHLIWRSG